MEEIRELTKMLKEEMGESEVLTILPQILQITVVLPAPTRIGR